VDALRQWARTGFAPNHSGLIIFADSPSFDVEQKPRPIGGFIPDLHARTFPASFTLLGEAKWFRDVDTKHTEIQLKTFLRFLEGEQDPHFVIATPPPLIGTALRMVRTAFTEVGCKRTQLYYLDPFGSVVRFYPAS
jgi:hypothetical protein